MDTYPKMKNLLSSEQLFAPALKAFRDSLNSLKRASYRKSIAECPKILGIYLIFHFDGPLLYVGHTSNVKTRLKAHLGYNDTLFLSYASEHPNWDREHVREMMLDRFQVSVIGSSLPFHGWVDSLDLEHFVQWVLVPKYGYWPYRPCGQRRIPEVCRESLSLEMVLKEVKKP